MKSQFHTFPRSFRAKLYRMFSGIFGRLTARQIVIVSSTMKCTSSAYRAHHNYFSDTACEFCLPSTSFIVVGVDYATRLYHCPNSPRYHLFLMLPVAIPHEAPSFGQLSPAISSVFPCPIIPLQQICPSSCFTVGGADLQEEEEDATYEVRRRQRLIAADVSCGSLGWRLFVGHTLLASREAQLSRGR